MADYICRNCGHMQCSSGTNGGCAYTFWFLLLIITIFIGLFAPIAFVVVAFEVLFLILTSRNPDSNFCFKCKARGCVVPFNTPAGQQIYKTFYPDEYEAEKQKEEQERQRKEEEAQAREDAGLSYLDKFHIEEPSIGKFLLFLLISAAIIFILFLSLSGIRTLIGAAPKKEVATTPQAQQQVKPAAKPRPKPLKTAQRLSTEQQFQDGKGVFIPLSEKAGIAIEDISLAQIFVNDKFEQSVQAYYIDTKKYPQINDNLIYYATNLARTISEAAYEEDKPLEIFVYTQMKDLYYIRNLPQNNVMELIVELMRQEPLFHIGYNPKTMTELCMKAPYGYKSLIKMRDDEQWTEGIACSYKDLKALLESWN